MFRLGCLINVHDNLQVEQTTERMRKWGGQDITIDKSKIEGLPIKNGTT